MTDRIDQFLEEHADGYGVPDYLAAVDALAACGVLTTEQANRWKSEHTNLQASGIGHQGPYDDEVETTATRLLDDLFMPVRPRASEGWDPATYQRYQEALRTLTGIGALSFERARPWFERQQQVLTPTGGRQAPEPEPDPELAFAAGELSTVIAGPPSRLDGMRVTCLELYGDCVVLRFHQLLPEEPADPVERREYNETPFELQDDIGTTYRAASIPTPRSCAPRGVEGWPEVLVGWQAFVPGAPLAASAFTVGWRDRQFDLPLRAPRA